MKKALIQHKERLGQMEEFIQLRRKWKREKVEYESAFRKWSKYYK